MLTDPIRLIKYDENVQAIAVQMVHFVMDSGQEDVLALELLFEHAVEQAREFLRTSIHD